MLNLKLSFKRIEFNKAGFKRDAKVVMEEVTLEALRVALIEMIKRVPVWTGEARGALKPIGRFVNMQIPIDPVAKEKGHTPRTGEKQSSCELTNPTGLTPTVTIDIQLFHFQWNEFNSGPTQGPDGWAGFSKEAPWHALEAGRKAFIAYMKANLKQRMPQISHYLIGTSLSGDPNGQ